MAKRECPYCKEKVKYEAVICMHCKSSLPPIPPKKWYQGWKGLLLVFFGLAIIGNLAGTGTSPSTPPKPETPEEIAAEQESLDGDRAAYAAKEYVKKALKAPSSAKFPFIDDFAVAPKTDKQGKKLKDVWEVSSYVDSQNSYGAMIRQQWYVKMKKNNDSWALLDIRFGN